MGKNRDEMPMGPEEYLEDRVDDQLCWYEAAANKAKRSYTAIQRAVIVMSAAVPVLVNLPSLGPWEDLDVVWRVSATLLALAVTILTGVMSFHKYGELWLNYRATEELLKQEKFYFLTKSAHYKDKDNRDPFPLFVERIEAIISQEHGKFQSLLREVATPAGNEGGQ